MRDPRQEMADTIVEMMMGWGGVKAPDIRGLAEMIAVEIDKRHITRTHAARNAPGSDEIERIINMTEDELIKDCGSVEEYQRIAERTRQIAEKAMAQGVKLTHEMEEMIEAAFWEFDNQRNKFSLERDAFKGQMRQALRAAGYTIQGAH